MRSSGSTRNPPPEPVVPLWVFVVGDDHPKSCTGRKLLHAGRAQPFRRGTASDPLLLDPYAPVPLSPDDRADAERAGILAVDCSWNRLSDRGRRGQRADWPALSAARRLPWLLATNPQHFGRAGELNTVEALAASLCVVGHRVEARTLLEDFPGGPSFFRVNEERLRLYARARSADEVRAAERVLWGGESVATRSAGPRDRSRKTRPPRPPLRRSSAEPRP